MLFHQGHDASSALHCIKTDLLLQHGEDYYKAACDGKFVPTQSIVCHLFYKEFAIEHGTFDGEEMFKTLIGKLEAYTAEGRGKGVFSYTTKKITILLSFALHS